MSILTESRLISRDSKEDGGEGGPRVLVLYQEGWAVEFQADSGPIPGNSQRCSARYKFPRKAAEVILESWCYTRSTGTAVILESWCYTRKTGTAVVHTDGD